MATVVKDFKVKAGLIVEGTTAKVNNFDILTKSTADQNYIIGLIGGSATSAATADTVVLRDSNGSFAANVVTADLVGDVTGSVTGNADTASTLETARTIALGGDVTGSVSFDGSQNVTITATVDGSFATDTEVATAKGEAIDAAAADATTKANAAQSAAESFATSADTTLYGTVTSDIATAKGEAQSFATAADTTLYGTVTSDIATAKSEAISTAASDATTKANTAESNAESYTDSLIGDVTVDGTSGNTVTDRISTAVSNLVDSAPATLDTLNELAAALQDNPDVISDLQSVAAGKQNTLTEGANIDITDDVIAVVNLASTDISDFDAAAVSANTGLWDDLGAAAAAQSAAESFATSADTTLYSTVTSDIATAKGEAISTAAADATTKANTAETNAKSYADGIVGTLETAVGNLTTDDIAEAANLYFTDERAQDAVAAAIAAGTHQNITINYDDNAGSISFVAENGVADSDTDDLDEGTTNLYFTDARAVAALEAVVPNFTEVDISSVVTQIAATSTVETASQAVAYTFDGGTYRSAKFLVKVAYGTHTEVSEVLLTLDTSDNIAITEYAVVGTNGSASTISAGMDNTDVQLLVTTTNNNSTITVMGTLLV